MRTGSDSSLHLPVLSRFPVVCMREKKFGKGGYIEVGTSRYIVHTGSQARLESSLIPLCFDQVRLRQIPWLRGRNMSPRLRPSSWIRV